MYYPLLDFNPADRTNDICKYFCSSTVYILVIIDSMCNRSKSHEIWRLYTHIRSKYSSDTIQRDSLDRFACIFIVYFSLFIFEKVASLTRPASMQHPRYMEMFIGWISDFWLFALHQLRIFYYVFYMNLLAEEFNSIDGNIKEIIREFNEKREESIELAEKLTSARAHYSLVRLLSGFLNEIFGWSHMLGILNCFVGVATGFNFIYGRFVRNHLFDELGETLLQFHDTGLLAYSNHFNHFTGMIVWFLQKLMLIGLLFGSTNACFKAVTKINFDILPVNIVGFNVSEHFILELGEKNVFVATFGQFGNN